MIGSVGMNSQNCSVRIPLGRATALLAFKLLCQLKTNAELSGTAAADALGASAPVSPPASATRFFGSVGASSEISAEYLSPTQNARQIKIEALEMGRDFDLGARVELQARFGVVHTSGYRTDTPLEISPNSVVDATTTGVTTGIGARIRLLNLGPTHIFASGSAQLLWTNHHPFPPGGTGLNGFLRGGGGFSFNIAPDVAIIAFYEAGHLSNASGVSPQNPMWNGRGGGLALRFKL